MRRFKVIRHEDKSGVSSTGTIGEGVEFDDGQVVYKWLTAISSLGIYPSMPAFIKIHGHSKATQVCYIDPEDQDQEAENCWPFRQT